MRITTQMLNNSFQKAGLPIPRTSLLDYINKNTTSSILPTTFNQKSNALYNKKNYEKIKEAADSLVEQTKIFTTEDRKNIFEKIKEGGEKEELYNQVEKMVSSYNNTLEALKASGDTMNRYYGQTMRLAAAENKEALASIGIEVSSGGKLSIDKKKLEAADIETVEKVLGGSSSFMAKTELVAGKVADNAKANVESVSTQYNASGNSYMEQLSRYDVKW